MVYVRALKNVLPPPQKKAKQQQQQKKLNFLVIIKTRSSVEWYINLPFFFPRLGLLSLEDHSMNHGMINTVDFVLFYSEVQKTVDITY